MRIDNPRSLDIPLLRVLWKNAFGDSDEFLDDFFGTAFSCSRCRCIFDDNDLPVSVLYWLDCSYNNARTAYLYAIATDAEMQGRGLCSTLMKDTEKYLLSRGYDAALLVPADAGLRRYYGRFGYKTVTYIDETTVQASNTEAAVRAVSPEEYVFARKKYIPSDGVVWENESVDFLSRQASLAVGDDFVLAYREDKCRFFCIELLGNVGKAPDILCALGFDIGTFRSFGDKYPFAMHLPLSENGALPPSYLGFAFD